MDGISPLLPVASPLADNLLSSRDTESRRPEEAASVGQEFESVFLSMLLKNMRSTVSEDGMFAGDESDTFGSMFDLFMSQHLASSDSLGIAKVIDNQLNIKPTDL